MTSNLLLEEVGPTRIVHIVFSRISRKIIAKNKKTHVCLTSKYVVCVMRNRYLRNEITIFPAYEDIASVVQNTD